VEDAEAFLALLESTERGGDLDDINALDQSLATLYARPDPDGDERLQVMTIHKAKGLEFDTVILPGLHAGQRGDDTPLLRWMQRPRDHGGADLLLAPVRADGAPAHDPVYDLIGDLDKEKRDHEQGRLLYVAVTRAVRCLDLIGFARAQSGEGTDAAIVPPVSGSLLARLWPAVAHEFHAGLSGAGTVAPGADAAVTPAPQFRRLPMDWQAPACEDTVLWRGGVVEIDTLEEEVEYDWASQSARLVGLVVHRFLQQIAADGLEHWDGERLKRSEPALRAMLIGQGTDPAELDEALARSQRALRTVLADENGRWILGAHRDAKNEIALSMMDADGPRTSIMDRTFVDQDGVRWIIDYKTGYRAGGDVEGFVAQEAERYRPALTRYAALMRLREPDAAIRAALYFPLLGRLHVVDVD
jgi:ATP-dependent helicase/nuclease subunit A